MLVERKILRHEPNSGLGANVAWIVTQHADASPIRVYKSHQDADAGGFSCAVGAKKSADFARHHLKRNVIQRGHAHAAEQTAIGFADAVEFNRGRHSFSSPALASPVVSVPGN